MGEITQLTEADFDDIFTLSQFAFQYQLSAEELAKKKEEAKFHIIWGLMEEGQLAAKLHLHSLGCYMHGRSFKMGGIGSVATWPEYRRQGSVKKLLSHALQYMKEQGQTVSFLAPFSFPFYRQFGWELTFVNRRYSLPMEKLKKDWGGSGYVRRKQDISLLQHLYTAYAKQYNGMLVRDEDWWTHRVLNDESFQTAVGYDEQGNAEGYLIFQVKDRIFTVKEMVYTSLNAWKVLLQFIANHDSMAETVKLTVPENDHLPLFIDEPRFKQENEPYFMARIVDVPAFLRQYPFHQQAVAVSITVRDPFIEENNGTYVINGETSSEQWKSPCPEDSDLCCSIQQLTSMMLGYKRPAELKRLGLISGSDKAVMKLEQLIPQRQTFLADFF